MMDLDMFAITCRSSRHTTCGPIINAERYVTYALIMSPCRNIQDTSSVGQRYAVLAKKRVDNICGTYVDRCTCVRGENVHASVPPRVHSVSRSETSSTFFECKTSWRITLTLH